MRVIIVGGGRIGANLATVLVQDGHEVVLLEREEARLEPLRDELDALMVAGDGASPDLLRRVRVEDSDLLIAVTRSDEVNVVAALIARQLGIARTAARVHSPGYFETGDPVGHDVLGIDFVFDAERTVAEEIADAIKLPGAVNVEYFGQEQLAVAESVLDENSPLVGQALDDVVGEGRHLVVGATRDGQAILPGGERVLRAGDHVLLAAAREEVAKAVAEMAGHEQRVEDTLVIGAGEIGVQVAERLAAADIDVTLMELDADRARRAAERLPDAVVLHERTLSEEQLIAAGVERVGALVACTDDDRTNLLAAFSARRLGCGLILPVIFDEEFEPFVQALEIQSPILPRLVAASAVLRFVHGPRVLGTRELSEGGEVVEFEVDGRAPIRGRTVGDADLPEGSFIGAIVRDGEAVTPASEERIEVGDHVLVFLAGPGLEEVQAAFEDR